MGDIIGYEDFYAIHERTSDGGGRMRVGGTVAFPTTGWSAALDRTEGNAGINPFMLALDLVIAPPAPGAPVLEVVTRQDVEWSEEGGTLEYTEVRFKVAYPAAPPPVIPVARPQ